MKAFLAFFLIFPCVASALEFKTLDGDSYTNATVKRIEIDGIVVADTDGVYKLKFKKLPVDVQKKYGYDPAKEEAEIIEARNKQLAAVKAQEAALNQQIQQQQALKDKQAQQERADQDAARAEETQQAANKIKEEAQAIVKNTKTIREVATDQRSYIGKPFLLKGSIEVSSYYNYGYANAQATHYTFELNDGNQSAQLYMQRDKAEALRKRLLDAGGSLNGVFLVVIDPERFNAYPDPGELDLEILDYKP